MLRGFLYFNYVPPAPCLVWIFCAVLVLGCGTDFPTHPVHGKVTFEGKPLPGGGSIRFVPLGGGEGKAAGGNIEPDGTYLMRTYAERDGALAGEHRVEIFQNEYLQAAVYAERAEASGDQEPGEIKPITPEVPLPPEDRVPGIYAGEESPLRATVKKGDNSIDFDLKRNP